MVQRILLVFLSSLPIFAQAQVPEDPNEALKQNTIFFLEQGFPAERYTYDNEQINLPLFQSLKYERSRKSWNTFGYVALGMGASGIGFGALLMPNKKRTTGDDFQEFFASTFLLGGALWTAASIPIFLNAASKTKKRDAAILKAKVIHAGLLD